MTSGGLRSVKFKGELGPLERAVMDYIWDRDGPVTVRDVSEGLTLRPRHAYTTLMTIMERLRKKGLLSRRSMGRANVYAVQRTREEHAAGMVAQVLKGATDRRSVFLGFVRSIDDDDLADLRKVIRDVERERRTRGSD